MFSGAKAPRFFFAPLSTRYFGMFFNLGTSPHLPNFRKCFFHKVRLMMGWGRRVMCHFRDLRCEGVICHFRDLIFLNFLNAFYVYLYVQNMIIFPSFLIFPLGTCLQIDSFSGEGFNSIGVVSITAPNGGRSYCSLYCSYSCTKISMFFDQ